MFRRTSPRELLGIALVVGAATLAMGHPGRDEKIIEALTLVSAGWICIAALQPWSIRTALVVAGGAGALALCVLSLGLGAAALIPFAVTVHHSAIVGWEIYRSPDEPRVALREAIRKKSPPPRREAPPKLDDDPFRSPPQAPPIVVRRPPTAPATVPVERDENAAKPTLLG